MVAGCHVLLRWFVTVTQRPLQAVSSALLQVRKPLGADAHHSAYCDHSIILAAFCHGFCQDRELKAAWNPGYLLHSTENSAVRNIVAERLR